MPKYSPIRNPSTNGDSFGTIGNLNIPTEPQLASTEAGIYLFLGFHKETKGFLKHTGSFGLKHILAVHENEIRNRGLIGKGGHSLIPEYVASIVRPGTKLYYEGEIRRYPRLLAWTGTEVGVLEFRKNQKSWRALVNCNSLSQNKRGRGIGRKNPLTQKGKTARYQVLCGILFPQ